MNDYKTKKLAEFDVAFKVGYQWKDDEFVDMSKWGDIKQFISNLIDEMESNAFLKDIVTKTRIDTLKKIIENLPNKSPDRGYNDCLWDIRTDLEMELEDLTNLNKE